VSFFFTSLVYFIYKNYLKTKAITNTNRKTNISNHRLNWLALPIGGSG